MNLVFPSPLVNYMCFGDSITVGVGNSQTVAECGWRAYFQAHVATRMKNARPVGWNGTGGMGQNGLTGGSGQRIDEVSPVVAEQVAAFNPLFAEIHLGTNDATQRNSGAWPTGTEQISLDGYEDMLDDIRLYAPKCRVFWSKIIPNQNAGADAIITSFNAALETRINAREDRAMLVCNDDNAAFRANASWSTDYMADTSHPNHDGYQVMLQTRITSFNLYF